MWISTASRSLAAVTHTLSHELVESITDPFDTGWHQTVPPPASDGGQIADVCDQLAVVDGVAVSTYWSVADAACIVMTSGTRRVSLSHTLTLHEPHDGPQQQGHVDFPIICGGADNFTYVERTYRNVLKVNARVDGYESPIVAYTINGQNVPISAGTIEVEADWDVPRSNSFFPDLKPPKASLQTWNPGPMSGEITLFVGPDAGNVQLHIVANVAESFDDPNSGGGYRLSGRRSDQPRDHVASSAMRTFCAALGGEGRKRRTVHLDGPGFTVLGSNCGRCARRRRACRKQRSSARLRSVTTKSMSVLATSLI